ncbi:RNA polymerase II subunit 5-mediating protein, putative [Pediculus humanus corporis]|uniref:RNA polymerase II subunit 5-mediating protein, putative n=1 Tax=Pediculus humanus subsp. corporis TaxID=121224 RepID=E0VC92_PEDHC|nr:RNA polymerase II subunit 5-mediating protein, putative [Pediculus humanus corporis]EEB11014.1 RNA polymerase II subunit 5-mediating protein, putative [Pediculus humanus corporis]
MPNGPKIDAKEKDGFLTEPPLFNLLVAHIPGDDKLIGYALYYNKYSTWTGKAMVLEDLYSIDTGCQQLDFEVLSWNPATKFYKYFGAQNITEKDSWHMYRIGEVNQWYESLRNQKLDQNDKTSVIWCKYKTDLETTKSLLSILPKKISHDVMVPIGPKALMRGKLVHTNEYLVNLGETWFVKKTAHQTLELCNRRIKNCNEMIQKLEKEKELILNKTILPEEEDAFGNAERPEIIEYVTEEENEEWNKQHRLKEKEYRLKLAELRNKEKKTIDTEEDLWKHLDELELREELEDELNRLNEDYSSSDDDIENDSLEDGGDENDSKVISVNKNSTRNDTVNKPESINDCFDETIENNINNNNNSNTASNSNSNKKRKVSFACDINSSDEEPLRLEIKFSNVEPIKNLKNNSEINSPSDIYDNYSGLLKTSQTSVLKNSFNPNKEKELEKVKKLKSYYDSESEGEECSIHSTSTIVFNDVAERNSFDDSSTVKKFESNNKKISKFKASRKN